MSFTDPNGDLYSLMGKEKSFYVFGDIRAIAQRLRIFVL